MLERESSPVPHPAAGFLVRRFRNPLPASVLAPLSFLPLAVPPELVQTCSSSELAVVHSPTVLSPLLHQAADAICGPLQYRARIVLHRGCGLRPSKHRGDMP